MKFTFADILKIIRDSNSESEFKMKCAIYGIDSNSVFEFAVTQVKNFWINQWTKEAANESLSAKDFFEAKKDRTLAYSDMTSVLHSMLYFCLMTEEDDEF